MTGPADSSRDRGELADALDEVEHFLRYANQLQAEKSPDHADFYAWGWALTMIVEQVEQAASTLTWQVRGYGDGRVLRDDAGMVPAERVDATVTVLASFAGYARLLRDEAAAYHSEVGHIAVDDGPGSAPDACGGGS